jgi:hypothetical protein
MARTDATQATANTARAALTAAMFTFVTSTLPPLHVTNAAAVSAMDPGHPTLDDAAPDEAKFYRACAAYSNALIAKGRYAGPALRIP